MPFYHHVPARYFRLIPAIYFGLIGIYDIGIDIWHHKLILFNLFIDVVLIIPLLINHRITHLVCGILFGILSLYGMFACFIFFVQYLQGKHFLYLFETLFVGPVFTSFSLLCALSLIYSCFPRSNNIGQQIEK